MDQPLDEMRIFALRNTSATEVAEVISSLSLQIVKDGKISQLRVTPEVRTNSIIAKGNEQLLKSAEDLIIKLDQQVKPPASAEDQQVQVYLYWFSTRSGAGEKTTVPVELKPVVKELERVLGTADLQGVFMANTHIAEMKAGKVANSAASSFSITGAVDGKKPVKVLIEGLASTGNSDMVNVKATVRIAGVATTANNPPKAEFSVTANVSTPLDHFVILGITPSSDADSAFVLQVRRSGPIAPGK